MKRLIILLCIPLLSISCSSDDTNDQGTLDKDPIIAKWQFGKVIYYKPDGSQEVVEPTTCDLQSSYTFLENHTIQLISYLDNGNGGCEIEPVDLEYYKWDKIEAGKYVMISKNPNEEEESRVIEAEFPDNKTMVTTEGMVVMHYKKIF